MTVTLDNSILSTYGQDSGINVSSTSGTSGTSSLTGTAALSSTSVPQVDEQESSLLEEMPALRTPSSEMSMAAISRLCPEALMTLMGFEERQEAVESGITSLEAHREERRAANQERIENLQEQAEKLQKQSLLDKIKQAFQIIGCVLGAIGSIAAIGIGAMTGNAALIIGGGLGLFALGDQITQLATGGEKGIAQAITAQAEKNGSNTTAANIAAQVMMLVIGVAGGLLSGGVGSSASAVSTLGKAATTAANAASALTQISSGAVGIASAVNTADIQKLSADAKDLEAILLRIQTASDLDSQNIEDILNKCENVTASVTEIIEECSETLGAVVTGAPAMA